MAFSGQVLTQSMVASGTIPAFSAVSLANNTYLNTSVTVASATSTVLGVSDDGGPYSDGENISVATKGLIKVLLGSAVTTAGVLLSSNASGAAILYVSGTTGPAFAIANSQGASGSVIQATLI